MNITNIPDLDGGIEVFAASPPPPFAFKAKMTIDADGCPRAYHPNDIGLDYLANAGHPGNWWAIVTHNGRSDGNPIVQSNGEPYPGYFISTTALEDQTLDRKNPRRYVDSEKIPFVVLPGGGSNGARLGDFCTVVNTLNDRVIHAIYADVGPRNQYGEGSIALASALGIDPSPKRGGTSRRVICYVFYPHSGNGRPRDIDEIQREGARLFAAWGGLDQVRNLISRGTIGVRALDTGNAGSLATEAAEGDIRRTTIASCAVEDGTYEIVTETGGEDGGQILYFTPVNGQAVILSADTTVFPLDERSMPVEVLQALTRQAVDGGFSMGEAVPASAEDKGIFGLDIAAAGARGDDQNTAGERLFLVARDRVGNMSSANGPDGGNLACAWAVNKIAVDALGHPIGGDVSTIRMDRALRNGAGVAIDESQVTRGCIIISPTGRRTGHVGILGEGGLIYSNSSARAQWAQNYTIESWTQRYKTDRNLAVKFYRIDR